MTDHHLVAIDGGGTGCRARVYDGALHVIGEASGGPANLLRGDGSDAIGAVRAVYSAAVAAAGLPHDARGVTLVAALAGATEEGRRRFFSASWPGPEVRLLSDAHAAVLGAHGGGDGGVVISGTGATACIRLGDLVRDIGGWGFAVDDFGSGADIGRRALRAALRKIDSDGQPGPADGLCARILGRFDSPVAAASWAAAASPADFGALAPDVFACADAMDAEATRILDRAVAELDRLVALSAKAGARRVAVVGSVGRRLAPRLRAPAPAKLVAPQGDALDGAAMAARLGVGWTA